MVKNITMSDIAKELGVSTVTVSKALSDKEGVSDQVRESIKEKAKEMGYRYNSFAKSMKDGTSGNIGIIVSERYFYDNAFYANLYNRNVMDLTRLGYSCILEIIARGDEREGVMPNMVENSKIDGLIVLGQFRKKYIKKLSEAGIPFIFQDFYDEDLDADSVVSDNVYGSYQLTKYLIDKGFTNIGFVGEIYATSSIMDRYLGYYKAILQAKLPLRQEWIIPDRDENDNFEKMDMPAEMPEAFVCNCDETAFRLVNQLKEQGYKIPEDISIIGFDDFIFATFCDPKLTTYRVGLEQMSETTVDAIIKKIKDENYRIGRKVIGGDIVIRDSVKECGDFS
ncbi:MAG: substrate-binding domain-containing protein [Lachnospiraceae bacterium]|nr:substrate-binding domain-containing protein [Lachnospiraceae bacterium]MBQ8263002.1 substrate-binding domain-containing protein [Lachnospiraceae bacterium]